VIVCQRWIVVMMTEEIGDGIGGYHEGSRSGWYDGESDRRRYHGGW
jgi:hypothetical protein